MVNEELKKHIFEELLKDTRLTEEQKKIIEFDPRISQIIDIIYEKIIVEKGQFTHKKKP